MVTQFGMSEKLGNIDYANEQQSFLGPYSGQVSTSQNTLDIIDAEVRRLVEEGYETAKKILTAKREDLERLAKGLLEYETLTGTDISKIIAGESLNRDEEETPKDDTQKPIFTIPTTSRNRRRRQPNLTEAEV